MRPRARGGGQGSKASWGYWPAGSGQAVLGSSCRSWPRWPGRYDGRLRYQLSRLPLSRHARFQRPKSRSSQPCESASKWQTHASDKTVEPGDNHDSPKAHLAVKRNNLACLRCLQLRRQCRTARRAVRNMGWVDLRVRRATISCTIVVGLPHAGIAIVLPFWLGKLCLSAPDLPCWKRRGGADMLNAQNNKNDAK